MKAIFTRYLYFKEEVCDTLIWSILEKKVDESMFWGYELYFSGFQYEVFEILNLVFETLFKEKNHDIGIHLNYLIKEWDDEKEKHYILGTIINILLKNKISLTEIMRTTDNGTTINNETLKNTFEDLSENDINEYYTHIPSSDFPARKILDIVCKYPIVRQSCDDLGLVQFNIKEKYKDYWLYFANFTPIWNQRILEYRGRIEKLTKSIIFDDEEDEEQFYKKYGYDPDEQSVFLKSKIWSTEPCVNISLTEFNKRYGQDNVFRTVKIYKSKFLC